jgi:hypothetical protein
LSPFFSLFFVGKIVICWQNFFKTAGRWHLLAKCWQTVGKKKAIAALIFTLILHYFNVLYGVLASVGKCCQK